MISRTSALLVLAGVACAATLPAPVTVTARVVRSAIAADTLAMTAGWTNPADDGKGALDSMRVRFSAGFLDSSVVYRPPYPTSRTLRAPIPLSAYAGTSAGYGVQAIVVTFRRGVNSPPVLSNVVQITLTDPPPPSVTGLTLQATKIP